MVFNLQTVLIGLVVALTSVGLGRLLMWQLESMRASINWRKVRLWWPTGMLFWSWAMLGIPEMRIHGLVVDFVVFLFRLLNFPALAVIAMALGLMFRTPQLPPWWLVAVLGSGVVWGANYLIVRLAEWLVGDLPRLKTKRTDRPAE